MKPDESTELYHIYLVQKGTGRYNSRLEIELNLSFERIERRFLMPYRRGQPMVINGKTIATQDLERIRIFKSKHEIESRDRVLGQGEVTQEFITGPPGSEIETAPLPKQELTPPTDAREVFVVHGRTEKRGKRFLLSYGRSVSILWNGQRPFSLLDAHHLILAIS